MCSKRLSYGSKLRYTIFYNIVFYKNMAAEICKILRIFSGNFQISPLTKVTKLMSAINKLSVSIYLSKLRTKTNPLRSDFG